MADYSCNTNSNKYKRVGNLVSNQTQNNKYTYYTGSVFAFQGEANFEKYKQEIFNKIPELGRDMDGNYVTPLPTNQDNICINGNDGYISIKSNHPTDSGINIVPIEISITGNINSSNLFKEADEIIKNSVFK